MILVMTDSFSKLRRFLFPFEFRSLNFHSLESKRFAIDTFSLKFNCSSEVNLFLSPWGYLLFLHGFLGVDKLPSLNFRSKCSFLLLPCSQEFLLSLVLFMLFHQTPKKLGLGFPRGLLLNLHGFLGVDKRSPFNFRSKCSFLLLPWS